jgi:hypothetical protein
MAYHKDSKTLDLNIKIKSSKLIDHIQDSTEDMSPEELADRFIGKLYYYLIDLPGNLGKVTLVPGKINCYAYWFYSFGCHLKNRIKTMSL